MKIICLRQSDAGSGSSSVVHNFLVELAPASKNQSGWQDFQKKKVDPNYLRIIELSWWNNEIIWLKMVDRFTELDMITLFIFTGPAYNPNLSITDELYLNLFLVWFCVNLSQKKSLHPLRLRQIRRLGPLGINQSEITQI